MEPTAGAGVGGGGGHTAAGADVHRDDRAGLVAGGEEGVPVVGVDGGQAQVRGYLGEGDGANASGGVAADLRGGQLGVPERDQGERYEPALRVGAAPLLHHPVVVGLDAEQAQFVVLGLGEGLAAETREGREADGRLDVVDVHVGEALRDVVGAGAHLFVRDDLQLDLVPAVADRRVETGEGALESLVQPPVAEGSVVPGGAHHGFEAAAQEADLLERGADDAGAGVEVLLREPVLPDVGGLHRVVVDGDDLRKCRRGLHGAHGSADLTARQLGVRRPMPTVPVRKCAERE
ncbi:hypothetical protein QFZ32_005267 [Streptomyces canus]|nr:hypothetical protein [Streptomyces canus]